MTPTQKIASFLGKLSAAVGVPYVREDQQGDKPDYPFMSYKIIHVQPEPDQCNIVTYDDDGERMKRSTKRKNERTVSLTFTGGEKGYGELSELADKAWDWVDSLDGLEEAYELEIGVAAASGVGDRTVFVETEWEYRLGFDIRFIIPTVKEEQAEPVLQIEIN